jgi:hypothetical protein
MRYSVGANPRLAALPLIVVGIVLLWWGWKNGAYFRVVFLPGSMVLAGLTIALLMFAPWPGRLTGPARWAVWSLAGLAVWTLLSALWSPSPDVAVADATRVAVYALAYLLGIWICLLLGRRMLLALVPVAGACAVVALLTLLAIWTGGDPTELLDVDATLRYPLGYRNAVAAFFLIGILPMMVLAISRDLDWRFRGALVGAATLSLELAVLSQSRAAAFMAVIGVATLIAFHPDRLRLLAWLLLAIVPAALALPWLLDVFQLDAGNTEASLTPLHTAAGAAAATAAFAAIAGSVAARAGPSVSVRPETQRVIGRALLAVVGVILLAGVIALARSDGGPTGFFSSHADELTAGTPDLSGQGTRFGLDLRSSRGDLWRVAIDDFEGSPAAGEGAGAFRFSYLLDREPSEVQPEDPHSVELLMLSELGLPGMILFGGFVVGAVAAAIRARKLGPSAAALTAGALAVGAYWLAHASVEWFWSYPAVTMPIAFVLGAAAAPALLRPAGIPKRGGRRVLIAIAVVGAVAMVPPFLSDRYTNLAREGWQTDLAGAYSELDAAADLNPLSPAPLVQEAVIAESAGEPQRALGALSRAQERVPDEWTLYFLEARILSEIDPASAARPLERARALNPQGEEIAELEQTLQP